MASEGRIGDTALLSKGVIEALSTPAVIDFDTIILDESIFSMGMKMYRRFQGTDKVTLKLI